MADEFYGQRDVMRMPEPEEFRQLLHIEPHLFLQIWPFRIQIWTEGVLVEHRAPVVRRCNFRLFRSKTDWTLLVLF